MRQDPSKHIEDACAAMAAALAQLVGAIGGETTAATTARSTANAKSERALRWVVTDATATAGCDELDDRASSGRRINVYLAGSRGCATLARTYGPRIRAALGLDKAPYVIKVGTTTGDLAERLRQIGKDGYGAAVRTKDSIEIESGFTAWVAHTISPSRKPPNRLKHLRRITKSRLGPRRRLILGSDRMLDRVEAIKFEAPHFAAFVDLVSRAVRLSMATGTPLRLPPTLLLGQPGIGKTFVLKRVAEALGSGFLAEEPDGESGLRPRRVREDAAAQHGGQALRPVQLFEEENSSNCRCAPTT